MAIDIIVINDSLKTVIILSFSYLDKKNLSSYLYCYSQLNFESNDGSSNEEENCFERYSSYWNDGARQRRPAIIKIHPWNSARAEKNNK